MHFRISDSWETHLSYLISSKCLGHWKSNASINQTETSKCRLYSMSIVFVHHISSYSSYLIYPYRFFKTRKMSMKESMQYESWQSNRHIKYMLVIERTESSNSASEWRADYAYWELYFAPHVCLFLGVLTSFTNPLIHKDGSFL